VYDGRTDRDYVTDRRMDIVCTGQTTDGHRVRRTDRQMDIMCDRRTEGQCQQRDLLAGRSPLTDVTLSYGETTWN